MQGAFTDSISSAQEELVVEIARNNEQVLEAKQLRYQVYCQERGFEVGRGNIEEDQFDANARHILVRSRVNGKVYGTARVVLSKGESSPDFPMEHLCPQWVFAGLDRKLTGEASRFAVTRDRSGLSPAAAALIRLCLVQGVIQIAGEERLIDVCALMEKTLLRLLHTTAVYFHPIGPTIEHRGMRQPSLWSLPADLARARRENRQVWSFITGNGRLWSDEMVRAGQLAA